MLSSLSRRRAKPERGSCWWGRSGPQRSDLARGRARYPVFAGAQWLKQETDPFPFAARRRNRHGRSGRTGDVPPQELTAEAERASSRAAIPRAGFWRGKCMTRPRLLFARPFANALSGIILYSATIEPASQNPFHGPGGQPDVIMDVEVAEPKIYQVLLQ